MTGDQLKTWRVIAELTQEELANILGVKGNTVARWEQGVVGIPPYLEMALNWQNAENGLGPINEKLVIKSKKKAKK